jgi:protoporphyrinogen oxidase
MGITVTPVTFDTHELTSALAAVTDALDRSAERVMRKNVPQYARDHHDNLKAVLQKLSEAYTETHL